MNCENCGEKIGRDGMSEYKAKCKYCGACICDSCFGDICDEKGEWFVMDCPNCNEEIWRK